MTIETVTALIQQQMYDRLNYSNNSNDGKKSNTFKNDRTSENGPQITGLEQREDRNIKPKIREITDVDTAGH